MRRPLDNRKHDLTRRTGTGALWLFGNNAVITFAKLLFLMILARLLVPEEFGLAAMATVIATFASGVSRLGVSPAIVQHPSLEEGHLSAGFQLGAILGVMMAALILATADLIARFIDMDGLYPLLQIVAFVPLIGALGQVPEGMMQRDLRFKEIALIDGAAYLIAQGLIAVPLAIWGLGAEAIVWGVVASTVIKTSAELVICPTRVALRAPFRCHWEILRFGSGASIAGVAYTTATNIDNLIIGKFLGPVALGIYSRAFQVVTMPTNLIGISISKVLFPALSAVNDDKERQSRAFLRTLGAMAMLSLPFSAFLFVAAPEIVWLLLGSQWAAVIIPFQILALAIFARVATMICGALIRSTGAVYSLALRHMFYASLVALGAYGGSHYGLNGSAFGVSIAISIYFLVLLSLALRMSGTDWRSALSVMGRHIILAIILVFLLSIIAEFLRDKQSHPLLVFGAISLSTVLMAVCISFMIPKILGEEGKQLRNIFQNIIRR